MKWLKRLSLGTLALVLLALLLVTLALNTGWGARLVLQQLAPMAPGQLQVREVDGTLAGPLGLEGFEYRVGPVTIRAARMRADLAVMDILTGRLRVEDATIESLDVIVEQSGDDGDEAPGPVELPGLSLPLVIDIRSLAVDGARLQLPGGESVTLDELALRGRLAGGQLELERLRLAGAPGRILLQGRLDTTRRYRANLDADVTLSAQGREFAGTVGLAGDLDRLALTVESRPPLAGRLEATLTALPWPPGIEAVLHIERAEPAALGIGPLPGPVSGRLAFSGDPNALNLEGWLAAAGERVEIRRLALARDGTRLQLRAMELEGRDGARVAASGLVALGGVAPRVALEAGWQDVAVPLGKDRVLASPRGRVSVNGRPSDYQARGELRLGGIAPQGTWRFQGRGDTAHFALERLEAETLGGTLAASGRVAWSPRLEWSGEVSGRELDPSVLLPDWPASLTFRATADGRLEEGVPAGSLKLQDLEGELRGRPVRAAADARFLGVERLSGTAAVRSGESSVRAEGRFGAATDLRLALDVNQAGDWHPDLAGSLGGELRLAGPRDALRVSGALQGSGLALREHRAGSMSLSLDAGLASGAAPGRASLELRDAELAGLPLNRLDVKWDGTRERHVLELKAADDERTLAMAAAGALGADEWTGRVTAMALAGPRVGDWRLVEPANLTLAAYRAALSRLCLGSDAGELCARGDWTPDTGLSANANLAGVPLALGEIGLRAATDRPVELTGRLDLEAAVRVPPDGAGDIDVRVRTHDAGVALGGTEGLMRLDLEPVEGRLTLRGRDLDSELRVGLDQAGSLALRLRSDDFDAARWAGSPVTGRLQVALDDLSVLDPLTGPVAAPAGALRGELSLDGALGSMGLGGSLTLSDFSAQVPRAGITLEQGRAEFRARAGELVFDARARSDGGELRAEGRLGFGGDGALVGRATLSGSEFQAADMPGLEAWVSPRLELTLEKRHLAIEGTVEVPRANVDAGELQGNGVSTSPDVIVAGTEEVEARPFLSWRAEVDVVLGEDIRLEAPGFEGSAEGRLHVSDRSGLLPLGQGQLGVSGTYEAYGQQLSIRSGRLLFSDTPLDNPALDITAVRETRDVTAGVRIAGTARQPRLTLFSEPPLGSESQILSYLILGRPLDSVSSSEGATLAGAATSLGLRGGNLLAQQLGSRFGLEDVEVGQSDALGQSALTLGKYLSPRLYIGYGIGLIEPVSVVRLRYELTDHWALEAASGKETTAAIKFNYER